MVLTRTGKLKSIIPCPGSTGKSQSSLPKWFVRPGLRRAVVRWSAVLLLCCPVVLSAQDLQGQAGELRRGLQELQNDPLIRRLLGRAPDSGLSPAQKEILEKAVDGMDDTELDESLQSLELSTRGTRFQKRERLKVALGLSAPPDLPASRPRPRVEIENASEGEYLRGSDDNRGLLYLRGRIRVRLESGYFLANLVIVDTERQEIYAEGDVVYYDKNSEVKAERLIFDQKLRTGIMYNAGGYREPIHFFGKNLTRIGEKRYSVSHAFFSSCAAELPHYNFTARRLWIYEDRKLVAVGVLYYVGGIPLLPLPFLYASEWGTGVITQMGFGQIQGWFMQNTYQFSVPQAFASLWQPTGYRITADYYQNTGEAGGIEFYKFSSHLNYFFQLGAAQYRRYEIVEDFREDDFIRITNNVRHADGTYGRENYKWRKVFGVINYRSTNYESNRVRNVQARYEDYTHRLYEFEFGGRYQPTSTIPALFQNNEAGRGLIRNQTDWNFIYNEQFDDISIRLAGSRRRLWRESSSPSESRYVPILDIAPSLEIAKRTKVGDIPGVNAPVYWDNVITTEVRRDYTIVEDPDFANISEAEFQTINKNVAESSFRSYFSYYPWITFQPRVGYGVQRTLARGNSEFFATDNLTALEEESKRNSYEYVFTEDELVLGPDFLHLRAIYRFKESRKEELKDSPKVNVRGFEDNQKTNETEVSLEAKPLPDLIFSVTSIYDHREFQYDVSDGERWHYAVFRSDLTVDFLNLGRRPRENLLSRQKLHFAGLRLTNDYIWDPVRKNDHSNVAGVNFTAGGFELPLLKRLRYIEMGFYWYHVYFDPRLDHMRYSSKLDLQITRTIFFEMQIESRATDIERYQSGSTDEEGLPNQVSFEEDIANGLGLNGRQARQDTVFNIGYFEAAFILDLHEWEMRFGYALEQRTLFAGVNSREVVTFYDNKVFFSLTLLRFDVGGVGDRPSRFLINRQRVRPGDVGRSSIQSRLR